jgi:hypothetical protein
MATATAAYTLDLRNRSSPDRGAPSEAIERCCQKQCERCGTRSRKPYFKDRRRQASWRSRLLTTDAISVSAANRGASLKSWTLLSPKEAFEPGHDPLDNT